METKRIQSTVVDDSIFLNWKESTLDYVFRALNDSKIDYCLLREYDRFPNAAQKIEVDLLIAQSHLSKLREILIYNGYVELPPWGHFPHFFFVGYDFRSGYWIKFDVVTEIRYGRKIRRFQLDIASDFLRARRNGLPPNLAPEHEFLTLLLHSILDKGRFKPDHCCRLKKLYREALEVPAVEQAIANYINNYLPNSINWDTIQRYIRKENWQGLLKYRKNIERKFFWKQPILSIWRNLKARILRKIRPFLFFVRQHGISIALLAPDGAGKSTLARKLVNVEFFRARLIYMGTNINSATHRLPTTRWFKQRVKSLNEEKWKLYRHFIKGLNYCNRLFEQWYRSFYGILNKSLGRFVIYDRYVYDSFLATKTNSFGKRIRRWLLRNTCPAPDLVILLDAPSDVLYNRKGEHSPEILERQRQVFLNLKNRIPNMTVVDATQDAEKVQREVISLIWNRFRRRELMKGKNGRGC